MKVVEIFKTNVNKKREAYRIVKALLQRMPGCAVNFDLDDCDNILRVETHDKGLNISGVISLLNELNYSCEQLTD